MRGWNYRVVREVFKSRPDGSPFWRPISTYSVLEVYYNDEGAPSSWIAKKAHLSHCNDFEDLQGTYELLEDAFNSPTLYMRRSDAVGDALMEEDQYEGPFSLKDRLRGCLLGCAIGDAIGVPLERRSADAEDVKPILDNLAGGFRHYSAPWKYSDAQSWRVARGQYSDDTQLMRLIYETLIEGKGNFIPEKYAEKLVELFEDDNPVGFGKGTRAAIERLKNGEDWNESGTPAPSAGNGSAMRSAIFGVVFDDMEDVITATAECSLPTHKSPEAVAGAVTVAVTARFLRDMDSRCLDVPELLRDVSEVIEPLYEYFADDLLELANFYDEGASREELIEWTLSTQPPNSDWPGVSPYVRTTVLWALNAFLLSPDNFKDTILNALAPGGDVDTTAAIAGALSGVYNGMSAIPDYLVEKVHDRGNWKGPELQELSDELYTTLRTGDE